MRGMKSQKHKKHHIDVFFIKIIIKKRQIKNIYFFVNHKMKARKK